MPLTTIVCEASAWPAAGACCARALPAPATVIAQAAANSVTRKVGRVACLLQVERNA